jgi:2-oxoglutarate dehydrogenase E2 component (dihydrolipoamide succinyltransferase)
VSYSPTEDEHTGTVEVTMPETGSPGSASVVAWLKQPGEQVEAEEPICLVSWDDVTAEVASPTAGVLRMLALAQGNKAETGTSLAVIDIGVRKRTADPAPQEDQRAVPDGLIRDAPVAKGEPVDLGGFLSPAVRRFADRNQIDPSSVRGTGRDGRVTLSDLTGAR